LTVQKNNIARQIETLLSGHVYVILYVTWSIGEHGLAQRGWPCANELFSAFLWDRFRRYRACVLCIHSPPLASMLSRSFPLNSSITSPKHWDVWRITLCYGAREITSELLVTLCNKARVYTLPLVKAQAIMN